MLNCKSKILTIVFICNFFLLSLNSFCLNTKGKSAVIYSPDGSIQFIINNQKGKVTYSIVTQNRYVIEVSGLGLLINNKPFAANATIGKVEKYTADEHYAYWGVHSLNVNKYNGAKIHLNSATPFVLDARVFNDGVAFRYLINNEGSAVIEGDSTTFVLPQGSTVWSQSNIKSYEGKYSRKLVEEFKKGDLIGPPATILLPGKQLYLAITEGGLTDFAGMSLVSDGASGFTANLTGNVTKTGMIESPWRIIEIGKDLNTLVNCDIIANVSPPVDKKLFPKGYETGWLKPGRAVWSWLAQKRSITLANMENFTDMAAQLGFEYNLVDEGWSNWKDSTRDQWDMMKELVDYSAKKGVKIWVWKAYPNRKGIDGINTPEKRTAFFKRCKDIGVAGLKIDFFDSESQEIIDFYQSALKEAAENHLMIDFHGANKPTGENRTWPNELTREGIRGLENQPPWAPGNTIMPFTRFLAGPADFTPVHFGTRTGEVSWAHHVASMIVFTSPLMCLGADPQSILDNPCKEMIKSIPTVWDETIVLPQSKIGELAIFARRKGNKWFLAAMNGEHQAKSIKINLSFLGKGNYKFSTITDDAAKQANALLATSVVSGGSAITINLNPEGGFVGSFEK